MTIDCKEDKSITHENCGVGEDLKRALVQPMSGDRAWAVMQRCKGICGQVKDECMDALAPKNPEKK